MAIEVLVPQRREISLADLSSWMETPRRDRAPTPFSQQLIDFCTTFSQLIFSDREAKTHPELIALAFWMRRAEILRLSAEFDRGANENSIRVPRGLTFHIPPSNVDTIFVYSWLLAMLTGNRSLIRMSSRRAPQSEVLLRLWRGASGDAADLFAQNTLVVSYGHDDSVTAAISQRCDVRVIWGGDQTVGSIRKFPLQPRAHELTFPDRRSLSVIQVERYLDLGLEESGKLAERFFNDAFWFDQMACSSPRVVIWCGSDKARAGIAAGLFWQRLAACIDRKGYQSSAAVHTRKFLFSAEAVLNLPVSQYRRVHEISVLALEPLTVLPDQHCGGGLFFSATVEKLAELVGILGKKDQTLSYFGFEPSELHAFARLLGDNSVDRMVPVGQALQFNRLWDGYDLLNEFCRTVSIVADSSSLDRAPKLAVT